MEQCKNMPVHCFPPGWCSERALFVVCRWDSQGAKVRKSCGSHQILHHEDFLANLAFDTAESKPCKAWYEGLSPSLDVGLGAPFGLFFQKELGKIC